MDTLTSRGSSNLDKSSPASEISGSVDGGGDSDGSCSGEGVSPPASIAEEGDYETNESCEEVGGDDDDDLSQYLLDESFGDKTKTLVSDDPCDAACLKGKESDVENFLMSISKMEKREIKTSILTALAILVKADNVREHRGKGVRERFDYVLPLGHIRRGYFSSTLHGNLNNKNASVIDLSWLTSWFREFAGEVGDFVPVRVRMKKTKEGVIRKYYSSEEYTFLPASFTWDCLYEEMKEYVELSRIRRREPVKSTIQNLTCPSVSDTPAMWYFLSMLSISVFGIYFANEKRQYNYVYDERVSGKGTDQVNAMLYDFIQTNVVAKGMHRLTMYADNCGGQSKSNYVIHFLLELVDQGLLDEVVFKFFVRVENVVQHVAKSAKTSVVKHITTQQKLFKDFKTILVELKTSTEKVTLMFHRYLSDLPAPKPNAAKLDQMYRKVRPFVPAEFADDVLYAKPTAEETAE
ncbi:Hypothetical protein PHPALM_1133 [Phytophthora palmivora]|uniref:Uncharacterized protein n=1 Tax=Phytophthora palmivora TaxID=4796 RepID=A0A2P4YT32_9STRA|nr:Hypothetical protein PHPALM_1133 [Phytophthora palmivora]